MPLKYKYVNKQEIPAEQQSLYLERDGAFFLDAEGVVEKSKADELRNHNIELRKQIEDSNRTTAAHYQFNGTRTTDTQAMQWPRSQCPALDNVRGPVSVLLPLPSDYVPFNSVPKAVQDATCETARALLIEDRTANPDWLDKAIRIIGKSINEKNSKQRGKLEDGAGE